MFQYSENIRKSIKDFNEHSQVKNYKNYACTWGWITEADTIRIDNTHYCHEALGRARKVKDAKYLLNSIQHVIGKNEHNGDVGETDYIDSEIGKAFYNWLVNESPYQTAFISKDIDRIWKDKVLLVSLDVNNNLMASAMIACRAASEHEGDIAKTWWKLINIGINKTLAFVLSHIIVYEKATNTYLFAVRDWHVSLDGNLTLKDYKLFKNYEGSIENTYRNELGYDNINYFYTNRANLGKNNQFKSVLEKISKEFEGVNKNGLFFPQNTWFFRRYIGNNNSVIVTDESVIKFQEWIEKEMNNE